MTLSHLCTVISTAVTCLLFAGCAASHKSGSVATASIPVESSIPCETSNDISSLDPDTPLPNVPACTRIADLIRNAGICAHNAEYPLANRLLTEASDQIETDQDLSANEWQKTLFHNQIVTIYTELMPAYYADSTSDEISLLLFQDQFDESFDSTDVLPQDTLASILIECQRRTQFDFPMVCNARVLKALRFLKSRRKGPMDKWLERADYYLPVMKQVFADSGLPRDLAYLPLIESGFNSKAYSRARASGIWQFIPSTGKRFGLRQTYWVDERRDPMKATAAAASYLKKLYAQFDNWYLALASYNCGENGMQRNINACGTTDFWKLKLPRETMNYIPEFLAALVLAKNPERFGLHVAQTDTFTYDTVAVSDCIDLMLIEKGIGLDSGVLRDRNPHIMHWCTPPDVPAVSLYLPLGYKEAYLDLAQQLDTVEKIRWVRHTIARGENLGSIARRYGMTPAALRNAARLKSDKLRAGSTLLIPVGAVQTFAAGDRNRIHDAPNSTRDILPQKHVQPLRPGKESMVYRVAKGDNLSTLSELFDVSLDALIAANNLTKNSSIRIGMLLKIPRKNTSTAPISTATASKRMLMYEVKRGDTVWDIAQNFGVPMKDLFASNNIDKSKRIVPGDTLRIPVERM